MSFDNGKVKDAAPPNPANAAATAGTSARRRRMASGGTASSWLAGAMTPALPAPTKTGI